MTERPMYPGSRRMREVFRNVFDDEALEIWDGMTPQDVAGWDSLAQVKLIIGLQEEFEIEFTTDEASDLRCVGDLKRALQKKGILE